MDFAAETSAITTTLPQPHGTAGVSAISVVGERLR